MAAGVFSSYGVEEVKGEKHVPEKELNGSKKAKQSKKICKQTKQKAG